MPTSRRLDMFWREWYATVYPDRGEAPPMDAAIFTCGICGKNHLSTDFGPTSTVDPQQKADLRQAWLDAEDKFAKSPNNEHLERAYLKAWFAYAATMPGANVARLPSTITTARSKGWVFVCKSHEQAKEKGKEATPAKKPGSCGDDCCRDGEEANLPG